jgi:mRNA-degrading endonuclease toxin of MazEF toxin-antitoxin module
VRAGELFLVDFGPPVRGIEQANVRPALVVHGEGYQLIPGLALVCPVTRAERGVPNHVAIPANAQTGLRHESYVMTEQVRAVDRRFVGARLGVVPDVVSDLVLRTLRDRLLARPRA